MVSPFFINFFLFCSIPLFAAVEFATLLCISTIHLHAYLATHYATAAYYSYTHPPHVFFYLLNVELVGFENYVKRSYIVRNHSDNAGWSGAEWLENHLPFFLLLFFLTVFVAFCWEAGIAFFSILCHSFRYLWGRIYGLQYCSVKWTLGVCLLGIHGHRRVTIHIPQMISITVGGYLEVISSIYIYTRISALYTYLSSISHVYMSLHLFISYLMSLNLFISLFNVINCLL